MLNNKDIPVGIGTNTAPEHDTIANRIDRVSFAPVRVILRGMSIITQPVNTTSEAVDHIKTLVIQTAHGVVKTA